MTDFSSKKLSEILGYQVKQTQLLERALTHSSTESPNNENLEFLGDSVLNTVVSDHLYHCFPNASEGELTMHRSQTINNKNSLYNVAVKLSLEEFVQVGKSFPIDSFTARRNLLANTLEAVIGAIYLDGGLAQAKKFVFRHFNLPDENTTLTKRDSKSRLQEYLQSRSLPIPTYQTIEVAGEQHQPNFTVSCSVNGIIEAVTGQGTTKKEAEQEAAAQTYAKLRNRDG